VLLGIVNEFQLVVWKLVFYIAMFQWYHKTSYVC